ncbi:hypothetical protein SAMN04488168_102200 [Bacillus sp. 491mf]|nr:hypothetical protein SAMN04488168_102200 [Bacillus sp. 491mf]
MRRSGQGPFLLLKQRKQAGIGHVVFCIAAMYMVKIKMNVYRKIS